MCINFSRRSDGGADFHFEFNGMDWLTVFATVAVILILINCAVCIPTDDSTTEESESQISAEITETVENDGTPEASQRTL